MARTRHRSKNSTSPTRATHVEKIRFLSSRGVVIDPTNARTVARKYREVKSFPAEIQRRTSADNAAEAKHHGFHVIGNSVVIDGPRTAKRKRIKGSRVQVLGGGVVKMSVGKRSDYIYGFTKKEKLSFADNTEAMEKTILERLRSRFPNLRKKKVEVRLQWGAYQGTKEFSPSYFSKKYLLNTSPEAVRKHGKKKARKRLDNLTGFHFVVHQTNARKGKRRRKGK